MPEAKAKAKTKAFMADRSDLFISNQDLQMQIFIVKCFSALRLTPWAYCVASN
jgi:hypothetical protein